MNGLRMVYLPTCLSGLTNIESVKVKTSRLYIIILGHPTLPLQPLFPAHAVQSAETTTPVPSHLPEALSTVRSRSP
jgi:hypothetical protein